MLKLKPFKKSDAAFVAELLRDEKTYALVCGQKFGDYPVKSDDITRYYESLEKVCPMTAFLEGRAVGHIDISISGESALLSSVVIDPNERGKGLGKKMLLLALELAFKGCGAKEISIGVFEENLGALSIYKSLGFKEDKKEERAYLGKPRPYLLLKLKGENNEHL